MPSLTSPPSHVLWRTSGNPAVNIVTTPSPHTCALCGLHADDTAPLQAVVSEKFTDWDRTIRDADRLCPTCIWALRTPALRTTPHLIDVGGAVDTTWLTLATTLTHPLDTTQAAVIPGAGRKHLVPFAQWGHVTSDQGNLVWGQGEARLTVALLTLRSFGATEKSLRENTMPNHAGIPATAATKMLTAYETARAWRGSPAWPIALRVTRPQATA